MSDEIEWDEDEELAEMQREWDRLERHFKKRIELLSKIKTKKYMEQLRELMKEAGVHDADFVRKTTGEKQRSEFTAIKWEWVDQYENGGYSGDSFAGYIYIQVKPNRYLKLHYSM